MLRGSPLNTPRHNLAALARSKAVRTSFARSVSMVAESYKYVVLGGGNAGGYAAREFVEKGASAGEVAVIGAEPYVSYERPALSKAYLFPEKPARLPGFHTTVGGGGSKQEPGWYKEHGVEFKTNTLVTGADVKAHTLTTESGDTITYEKLIVATGSGAIDLAKDFKIPGGDMDGIYYLRDVVDADKLVAAIQELKKTDGKAVIIGGGYIGMELSASLANNGVKATIVFPEPFLLARLFTPEIATFYEEFLTSKGITFMKGDTAKAFEGKDGKVSKVVLKSGKELPCDMVIAGVGAKPTGDMYKGQLDFIEERPGGIKVNGKLQSSDPDVYVVGDLANYPLPRYDGQRFRQEHVQNARESAAHAVSAILKPEETGDYNYLPYFYSRFLDKAWVFYGQSSGDPVLFGDISSGKFGTYWVNGGKVVGGFMESGTPDENNALKQVAIKMPEAPSKEELSSQGIDFALKL